MAGQGIVRKVTEFEWVDLAGHRDAALTKLLVTKETCGAQNLDVFLSSYAPKAYAEEHVHERTEECFYIIAGEGLFVLDGERHLVGPGTIVFAPPGTRHGIFNTGMSDLVFVVAASPPEPEFHEQYADYFVAPGEAR
ncbi:MAG TPA: cupin domain-containing protein [Acidimicrobiales bacterium]|nr:cupin domain-containing protein [Acidimicrobiales bacterium]